MASIVATGVARRSLGEGGSASYVCMCLQIITFFSLCAMRSALCVLGSAFSFQLGLRHLPKTIILFTILLFAYTFNRPVLAEEMSAEGKIKMADSASILAVKQAAQSRATCDPALLKRAAESINQAAVLMSEVAIEADNTGNLALAQEVYDMATNVVGRGIGFIKEVCMHCVQTSLSPGAVGRFHPGCSIAGQAEQLNNETIDAALAAGAIPPRTEPVAP
jgi:hypothetical protein